MTPEERLNEALEGQTVSAELREHLFDAVEQGGFSGLVVVEPDIAAYLTSRSEWGSSGGIGYFDQANVYYKGQTDMREWQWRDRYSASNDRYDLRINTLGDVNVEEKGDKVVVTVELVNREYGNRQTDFTFDSVGDASPTAHLNPEEQAGFKERVESEIARILAEKEKLWEYKPQMIADYGGMTAMPMVTPTYVPYQHPSVKSKMVGVKMGVAAFVFEEQIDHRESNPQLRYELYVLKHGDDAAHQALEDHAYEKLEDSAVIALVQLKSHEITINTRHGKRTINV